MVGHVGKTASMTFVNPSKFLLNSYEWIISITNSATGSPIESLFLGDVINIIVDYGQSLDDAFKLEISSCNLLSSSQSFGLIIDKAINQESDLP